MPITLVDLEKQIDDKLKNITILPEFRDWALAVLRSNNDQEIKDRSKIYDSQQKAVAGTQTELDNLTKMRYRDLIDDEMFLKERNELQGKLLRLRESVREIEKRADEWIELTREGLSVRRARQNPFQKWQFGDKTRDPKNGWN